MTVEGVTTVITVITATTAAATTVTVTSTTVTVTPTVTAGATVVTVVTVTVGCTLGCRATLLGRVCPQALGPSKGAVTPAPEGEVTVVTHTPHNTHPAW